MNSNNNSRKGPNSIAQEFEKKTYQELSKEFCDLYQSVKRAFEIVPLMYNRLTLVDGLLHKEALAKIANDHKHLSGFTARNVYRYLPAENPKIPRRVVTPRHKNSPVVQNPNETFSHIEHETKSTFGNNDGNYQMSTINEGSETDGLQDTQKPADYKQTTNMETENLSNQLQQESKETAHQIEFDFLMLFEDLRSAMEKLYSVTKGIGNVMFRGTLNTNTGVVNIFFCGNRQGEAFEAMGKGSILI